MLLCTCTLIPQLSKNMTENFSPDVPMNVGSRNGMFSHAVSPTESNALKQNNQEQILVEFPALSMLEGEHVNNFYTCFNISNHVDVLNSDASVPMNVPFERNTVSDPSCPISNIQVPISAASLATLLAARSHHHDDLKGLGTSMSNDYYDSLNSAFVTYLDCGYEGILGGATNSKRDSNNFQSFPLVGNINPSLWVSSENFNMSLNKPSGSSNFRNELSLSLASCQPSFIHGARVQCSGISCSCVTCLALNEKQLGPETSCNSKNLSPTFGSRGPDQILQFESGSTFFHVIQEILAEIASHSLDNQVQMNYPANGIVDGAKVSFCTSRLAEKGYAVVDSDDFSNRDAQFEAEMDVVIQRQEVEAKKKKLLGLLQLVDDQYNRCVDEIHTVISAFHAATELDPRTHTRFALQTIASLYKNLRERISAQVLRTSEYLNGGDTTREEDRSFETSFIRKQWALQQLQRNDHQLWRPQRGLPERSVSVLRAWMFQNFLHPYPKDVEKQLLAVRSGLTRSQVSNWFINARVRLWKPMIEEMYMEMNRRKDRRNDDKETESNRTNHLGIVSGRFNRN
ncbi:homeobox protein ATH1-like [Actinidia eriantha]|uniref:homeobox protein ATH1-like n=1 Tax=Actinidia eriantha TaxID=165200 RepID=UPI00258629A7|nr:homeobox protein ATH1-like [Actinidia eriantha]XP_057477302.1 homeobox protein ATH1-like [Actinidia eriantha]